MKWNSILFPRPYPAIEDEHNWKFDYDQRRKISVRIKTVVLENHNISKSKFSGKRELIFKKLFNSLDCTFRLLYSPFLRKEKSYNICSVPLWPKDKTEVNLRMRSSLVVKGSDCQCTSCNGPGFNPSIRRHSTIWGAAYEALLNIVRTYGTDAWGLHGGYGEGGGQGQDPQLRQEGTQHHRNSKI